MLDVFEYVKMLDTFCPKVAQVAILDESISCNGVTTDGTSIDLICGLVSPLVCWMEFVNVVSANEEMFVAKALFICI